MCEGGCQWEGEGGGGGGVGETSTVRGCVAPFLVKQARFSSGRLFFFIEYVQVCAYNAKTLLQTIFLSLISIIIFRKFGNHSNQEPPSSSPPFFHMEPVAAPPPRAVRIIELGEDGSAAFKGLLIVEVGTRLVFSMRPNPKVSIVS